MSSPIAIVTRGRLYTDWSTGDVEEKHEDYERSTDYGADDTEYEGISPSSSCYSMPPSRVVCFADEVANGILEEVIDIESFKDFHKFTHEDREQADLEWCEELLEQLDIEANGVACLQGVVVELADSAFGYEAVTYAFEIARGEDQAILLSELAGNILLLATSVYGSEVLQACLELMRPAAVSFIATELLGSVAKIACTEAGSAVLCRILEYLPQKYTAPLLEELQISVLDLCRHPIGSQVVSHLIDYSPQQYKLRMCGIISAKGHVLSNYRIAVPLLRKAQLYLRSNWN